MFKSSKPSKPAKKSGGGSALMQQMGFQMPNVNGPGAGQDDDDDDDDLEAELQRLQHGAGGGQRGGKSKANQRGAPQNLQSFHNDVSRLLNDLDRPINDDELSDVDEDDLLAELNEITEEISHDNDDEPPPSQPKSAGTILSLLQERHEMYSKAIAAAKSTGDTSKARRLERQFKTIQELLQSARTGAAVNESDIPPEVFVASQNAPASKPVPVRAPSPPRVTPQAPVVQPRVAAKPQPPSAAASAVSSPPHPARPNPVVFRTPPVATTNTSDTEIEKLKALALQAKQQGDMAKAKQYILRLRALQSGATPAAAAAAPVQRESYDNVPEDDEAPPAPLPLKAPEPRTVMEALQQRHEELSKRGEEAASRGDSSKSRRMERLSKQYEEAIDATRKGRAYDYAELPDIPGFGPIPVQAATAQPAPAAKAGAANSQGRPSNPAQQRAGSSAAAAAPTTASSTTTRKNQQAQTLRLKQEKFHKLALQAKQQGDIETAKKFLIAYKGLEQMIQAAESGLPIDMSQVPRLPDDDSELINDDDLTQDLAHADRDTVYRRLQDDLLKQMQLCARNQQIYSQMEGSDSIKHANDYKILEQRCSHDLEKLRKCFQHGAKPPLFHYERRQMNIVQVNHDLGENDLEVTILRGINLPVPLGHSAASLETYVTIEFPYPTETPQTARTRHVAGADNAEYPEGQHKFYIKRQDAKFRRQMNRKEMKLAVFYKPGFLRSDRPLGVASIKLAALEQTCTIHESVDLFESEHKKKIEGKLEVKLRIKEALGQTKASDILPQRWLVIDRFEEMPQSSKASTSKSSAPVITALARLVPTGEAFGQIAMNMAGSKASNVTGESSRTNVIDISARQQRRSHQQPVAPAPVSVPVYVAPQSVQVLNYEASMLEQQIEQLHDHFSPEQLHQLKKKLRTIQQQSDQLVESLRMGGKQAVQEHLRGLEELIDYYDQEARDFHQRRDVKKADICLSKKKLVMKEIETLTGKTVSASSTRF